MKTTRRGLFGLMAGLTGTLALGKGAAIEQPKQVWGIKQTPLNAPDGPIYSRDALYLIGDTTTEFTPREVGVTVRMGARNLVYANGHIYSTNLEGNDRQEVVRG